MFQVNDEDLHFDLNEAVMVLQELNQESRSTVNPLNLNDSSSLMDSYVKKLCLQIIREKQEILSQPMHLQTNLTRGKH